MGRGRGEADASGYVVLALERPFVACKDIPLTAFLSYCTYTGAKLFVTDQAPLCTLYHQPSYHLEQFYLSHLT